MIRLLLVDDQPLVRVDGVWWPVHLWAGTPLVAGLTGWLLSLLAVPAPDALAPSPAITAEDYLSA